MSTGRSGGSATTFRNQSAAAPVAASGSLRRSPYARAGPATALPSIPNKWFRRETNPRCRPSLSTTRVLAARHSRPATFVESARRRPALAGPGGFDRKMGAPVRVRPSNRLLKSVPPRLAVNVRSPVERLRLLRFKAEESQAFYRSICEVVKRLFERVERSKLCLSASLWNPPRRVGASVRTPGPQVRHKSVPTFLASLITNDLSISGRAQMKPDGGRGEGASVPGDRFDVPGVVARPGRRRRPVRARVQRPGAPFEGGCYL